MFSDDNDDDDREGGSHQSSQMKNGSLLIKSNEIQNVRVTSIFSCFFPWTLIELEGCAWNWTDELCMSQEMVDSPLTGFHLEICANFEHLTSCEELIRAVSTVFSNFHSETSNY